MTMNYKEFLDKWYGLDRVPPFGTPAFSTFVTNNILLAINTAETKNLTINFDNTATTAFVNMETYGIVLPGGLFTPEFYLLVHDLDISKEDLQYIAVLCVTGSVLHEAYHVRYTPRELDILHSRVIEKFPDHKKVARNIANIVEDLYINTEAMTWPTGNFIVHNYDYILFHDNSATKVIEMWQENKTWATGLNLLVLFKRMALRDHPIWDEYPTLKDAMLPVCETGRTVGNRIAATYNAFKALYDLLPEEEQQDTNPEGVPISESSAGQRLDGEPIDISQIDKAAKNKESERIKNEVQRELVMLDPRESNNNVPELRVYDVLSLLKGYAVREHPNFMGFASYLQHIRTVKRVKRPSETGKKIIRNQLHRWAIDYRVLNGTTQQPIRETPELVVLVDASGSMGTEFFGEVLEAAKAVFNSCKQSNIGVAVSAHTTINSHAAFYPIVSYRMTSHDTVDVECMFAHAKSITQSCNVDGLAILEASKHFTRRPGEKYLLVLSDGQPAGSYGKYHGDFAKDHTRQAAITLRKKGIQVFGVSLKQEVIKTNNEIYGREFNIIATDKSSLESSLKSVLERL